MESLDITIRFADLRRAVETVPAYVREALGVRETVTLRTAVEDDLGITGLDTEALLVDFGRDYRVDLTKFDFTGCISDESQEFSCLLVLVLLPLYVVLFLLAWAANALVALCWAPFNLSKANLMLRAGVGKPSAIVQTLLFPHYQPRPSAQVLTIGDFVASAAAGYFVKRERVRFVLTR